MAYPGQSKRAGKVAAGEVPAEFLVTRPGPPAKYHAMSPVLTRGRWPLFVLLLGLMARLGAHPIPDIPVRGFFDLNGNARIEIEIDVRFFAADPNTEPYLVPAEFEKLPPGRRAELIDRAKEFAADSVRYYFEPTGQFLPDFQFSFTGMGGGELRLPDDPVVLTGRWTTRLAAGLSGFRIQARPEGKYSIVLVNTVGTQQVQRVNILFPGESSYTLDLTSLGGVLATAPTTGSVGVSGGRWDTFVDFIRQGFVHVIPLGWDHILFVLGLFLLSRQWQPLLLQVTTFTVAHTLTLGLATLGRLSVPGAIVEPVIAASIAVIALENIFRPKYSPWRLAVVFVFGLVHGLGFAGALQELNLPAASLVVGLLGFNLGVEFGQIAVISVAWLATRWLRREDLYRKWVAVPASVAIAGFGLWWTVQRIAG